MVALELYIIPTLKISDIFPTHLDKNKDTWLASHSYFPFPTGLLNCTHNQELFFSEIILNSVKWEVHAETQESCRDQDLHARDHL